MKKRLGWLIAVMMLAIVSGCESGGEKQDLSWVLGKWELAHNPENDDEDVLIFDSDDSVTVLAEKGGKLEGNYAVTGDRLKISLPVQRKTIEVEFEVSSDRSKLIYKSGAYYMKK